MSDQPRSTPTEPEGDDLPEQMRVRRDKRERLVAEGVAPYPVSVERTHTLEQVRATYDGQELEPDTHTGDHVAITGRVMFLRNTGKLCFVRLREGDGAELQVMLSLADVGEESLADFKALVDLGDLLAVQGEVVTSRRGELSVRATSWSIAAKTLRPLPNEHKPLSDEARIRLRYVDMMVRPEPRDDGAHQGHRAQEPARDARRPQLRRGRDPDPPAHQRRRRGPAVPHATSTRSTRTCCCGSRSSST